MRYESNSNYTQISATDYPPEVNRASLTKKAHRKISPMFHSRVTNLDRWLVKKCLMWWATLRYVLASGMALRRHHPVKIRLPLWCTVTVVLYLKPF